jgi:hypothetical protein
MVTPCLCVTMGFDERHLVTQQGDQATRRRFGQGIG